MQELEVLKILADLVIFLISITIPTYAIAVSLLGPEYAKATKRITQEKERLEKELSKIMGTGTVKLEDLETKIEEFRKKEKRMKSKFNPLSLYPAVLFPNICFGLSLLTILIGMYTFTNQNFPFILGFYLIFIAIGLTILGWALIMIRKASKETV